MFRVMHPNRWFFWTLAILIALGLVIEAFIFQTIKELEEQASSPVRAPSISWKTYRSKDLGIAVNYPPSWQIDVDPASPNTVTLENPKNFQENISIVFTEPKFEKVIRSSLKTASEETVMIDNLPAQWLRGRNSTDAATGNVIFLKRDGQLYYIAGQAQVFERIIKSIKFLRAF